MTKRTRVTCLVFLGLGLGLAACSQDRGSEPATADVEVGQPPNVLLVVLDDVGYSDLGAYGSEIRTPNIDALAANGVLLSNFYAAPLCTPTRAMLLTGVNNHKAGVGTMGHENVPNLQGVPGYEGYLNDRVAPISEILQDAGYSTYMTGKWDLGFGDDQSPHARGFDKTFALLPGGAGHLGMMGTFGPTAPYRENGVRIEQLPDDYYSTAYFTDRLIEFIDGDLEEGRPFFAYLAYSAAHWPLQAPQESIDRYNGVYDDGYGALHAQRLTGLRAKGLISDEVTPAPGVPGSLPWDELGDDEQRYEARVMQTYAAMIDDMDRYIGRLVDYLKSVEAYEDTVIIVMSDNGAEGHDVGGILLDAGEWKRECCDDSVENIGNANSYVWASEEWARVSNAPWRWFKGFGYEGGIRAPAIIHYAGFESGIVEPSLVNVKDIAATILDVTGVGHPGATHRGKEVFPVEGKSAVPVMTGAADAVHDDDYVMIFEINWRKAIRQGDWKLVSQAEDLFVRHNPGEVEYEWALYNLAEDPTELHDLTEQHAEVFEKMMGHWNAYVEENGVVMPSSLSGF